MLYKYLPRDTSFDSTDTPGSLSVIRDGTLKYTSPIDFNDPFDCQPDYDLDALFNSILEIEPVSPLEVLQGANPSKHWNGEWLHEQYVPAFGVCCFSRNAKNILMWSHYASDHRGIAVEFQSKPQEGFDNQDISASLSAMEVKYQDQKPLIEQFGREFDKKLLLTKSRDWEYEEESRVVLIPSEYSPLRNVRNVHGIYQYDRHLLRSVIAGVKCDPKDIALIEKEVASINEAHGLTVEIKRVVKVPGEFAVEICDL